jgi:hypothetical protein
MPERLTPLQNQARAAKETGYKDIKLRGEGEYVLVQIDDGKGSMVTVIRQYVGPIDGMFDHTITSLGIEAVLNGEGC